MTTPTVAVVMPFHEDVKWFPDALASVLNQTVPPTEVIVVDDASSTGSRGVLDGAPGQVRVVHLERNGGPGNARQVGSELATSEYLSYLDSDDLWCPKFLEVMLGHLARTPAVAAVYSGIAKRLPSGELLEFCDKPAWLDVREAAVRFHAYPALGMVFRRTALMEVGGWDRSRTAVEDWDLMVRFLDRHGPIPLVRGVLPQYRVAHEQGRLNSQVGGKLLRWWHTARRNRELLGRHFGPGAGRRRFAQAVADRADRVGGPGGRGLRLLSTVIGPPLVDSCPVVS